jgi:hypothetical protein
LIDWPKTPISEKKKKGSQVKKVYLYAIMKGFLGLSNIKSSQGKKANESIFGVFSMLLKGFLGLSIIKSKSSQETRKKKAKAKSSKR